MKLEEIVFWAVAAFVIIVAAWTLFGSPGLEEIAFMVALAAIGEIFLLHREFYLFKGRTEADSEHFKNRLSDIESKLNKLLESK